MDAANSHPVFDPSVLDAMFGKEPALVASVLQTYVASNHTNLADLARALAAQDLSAMGAMAHKIAGASRMSGALALGHSARKLELAAKQGNRAALAQGVSDVQAQWALTQTAIARLMGQQ